MGISVNVSGREFSQPYLVEEVSELLRDTGLDPEALELEITETVLMENEAITEVAIRGLKSLGVRLAIDDFGTGYASPSYLKRFPIDTIKIDRSIVEGIDQDPQDEVIAAPAVAAARGLGASVVAEGIESASQVKRLREFGCDIGQGYYLGRPAHSESTRWHASWRPQGPTPGNRISSYL